MPNYKSVVGLDNIYYALVSQDDASAYAAGAPTYLAPAMTIGIEPAVNTKTQYADNKPFDVMTSEGESKLPVEITGLPLDVLAVLLGKVYDFALGRMFDGGGVAPYVALGFRAKKSDGKYRYYWFLKGTFAPPKEEVASQTDSPDPKSTKLDFTAIKTTYEFPLTGSITDSVKRVMGDTADTVFDASTWFNAVQVPSVGAPSALTCTPSPADAATGQTTTVAITLTFNNAIRAGAELGVTLTRVDTGAVIAVTRSLNAARKVLTLTHAALTATKQYFITVSGVVDIYGQALADVVYDFTIA